MRRIDFVTLKLFVAIADEREHLALAAVSKRVSMPISGPTISG
ncbi:hypothetical protein SAMN05216600_101389 [Pseudomonas cuatrocienegasensis]|uniref:Regulatory helix-turn-helix protein, lysR family n=1 Tax=Pseudomonas cuatrocienegasensis TaxID=543360 RepID=A0ABY1B1T3_9PSED|nr:hypothetical protein SAMN05216600_101389 [Pseudomonas cuatrocienegasensis]